MATAPINWQKSSFSEANGDCVELAAFDDVILLRESDRPGEVVTASRTTMRALLLGVKAGEFDHLA